MAIYSDLSSLNKALKKAAAQVAKSPKLIETVKNEIRQQERKHIYDTPPGILYQRRHSLGKIFEVEYVDSTSFWIWDAAKPSESVFGTEVRGPDGVFAQWINDGRVKNVFSEHDYPWNHPRPFYRDAAKALEKSNDLNQWVIDEIKNKL